MNILKEEENLIDLNESILNNQLLFHQKQNSLPVSKLLYRKLISNAISLSSTGITVEEKNNQSKRNSILQFINPIKNGKLINMVTYKELKRWTYKLLERPTGQLSFIHYLFNFSLILLSILFSAFSTIKPIQKTSENLLFFIELFVITYFFVEYCIRLWYI
jgi:hypothetical protein